MYDIAYRMDIAEHPFKTIKEKNRKKKKIKMYPTETAIVFNISFVDHP